MLGSVALHVGLRTTEAARIEAVDAGGDGTVSVVVRLPDGEPLPSGVSLLEDGDPTVSETTRSSLSESGWTLTAVLCVDVSGSFNRRKGDDPLAEMKDGLRDVLVDDPIFAEGRSRIELLSFADDVTTSMWFERPGEEFSDAIDGLGRTPSSYTAFYAALDRALDDLQKRPIERRELRRVLAVTDCKDEPAPDGPTPDLASVRDRAMKLGIPIDVIARIRGDRSEIEAEEGHVQLCRALAEQTGGVFVHAKPRSTATALRDVLAQLNHLPVLSFQRALDADGELTERVGLRWQADAQADAVEIERPVAIAKSAGSSGAGMVLGFPWWVVASFAALLASLPGALWFLRRDGSEDLDALVALKVPSPASALPHGSQAADHDPRPVRSARATIVGGLTAPPAGAGPSISIVAVNGSRAGARFNVSSSPFTIGADPANDLCIADSEYVSGRHARIRIENGRIFVSDCGSTNGTWVNETRVSADGQEIRPGDRMRLGDIQLDVQPSGRGGSATVIQ